MIVVICAMYRRRAGGAGRCGLRTEMRRVGIVADLLQFLQLYYICTISIDTACFAVI